MELLGHLEAFRHVNTSATFRHGVESVNCLLVGRWVGGGLKGRTY